MVAHLSLVIFLSRYAIVRPILYHSVCDILRNHKLSSYAKLPKLIFILALKKTPFLINKKKQKTKHFGALVTNLRNRISHPRGVDLKVMFLN